MRMHKDLEVWKRAIEFVVSIYKLTETFPKEERYGLTAQMRDSSVSIPSNIAEGAGRNSNKEYIHFLYISLGSAAELETQLIISDKLNYIKKNKNFYFTEIVEIIRMLHGLITSRKRLDASKK
ncbi:MAG: four helix bundle protein [Candidatus Cloacimonetes bacterium]|nr:four helix bundle protein [Candidatus Cloacimonadota bacterium]